LCIWQFFTGGGKGGQQKRVEDELQDPEKEQEQQRPERGRGGEIGNLAMGRRKRRNQKGR